MKKLNLIKVVSILLISLIMVMLVTTTVHADNNTGFSDLTNTLTSNNATNNTSTNNTSTNNTSGNNKTTNNSSLYNNTNLPKTGIEDSIPVAMLVVVFGISALFAYKRIKDYRNI